MTGAFHKDYVELYLDPPCPDMSGRHEWDIDMITLHFTKGLWARGTAKWGKNPKANGCAHFYVGRSGEVIQSVSLGMRAWQHGRSRVEYEGKVYTRATDRCSIGIEMANCGHMFKADNLNYYFTFGEEPRRYPYGRYGRPVLRTLKFSNGALQTWWWEPYPDELVASVTKLTADLVSEFDIPIHRIVGHEDVATPVGMRKFDPGPMWDWKTFIPNVCDLLGVQVPDDVWRLHKTVR